MSHLLSRAQNLVHQTMQLHSIVERRREVRSFAKVRREPPIRNRHALREPFRKAQRVCVGNRQIAQRLAMARRLNPEAAHARIAYRRRHHDIAIGAIDLPMKIARR